MNSWKSVESIACLPPLRMFTSGTGRVRAPAPPRYRYSGSPTDSAAAWATARLTPSSALAPSFDLFVACRRGDQQAVEADLVDGVDAEQLRAERLVDVAHRGEHALAAVALRVAVAQLDRLVGAGRGAGRDDGRAHRAVVEEDVDLDRRVAARVEDLAADDILDQRGHWSLLPRSIVASAGSSAATPGSVLPSRNSSEAPPPVLTWVILSAEARAARRRPPSRRHRRR